MSIKHKITILSFTCLMAVSAMAQSAKDVGMISLNPYIPETENLGKSSFSALTTKLQQIATANGMSGAGFDNRFIITAHVQMIRSEQTQTFPQKNAVEVNIGIYVGDGLDGTLYSSYTCQAKGIGDSEDRAIAAAIRKMNPNAPELQAAVAKGKQEILNYYDKVSGNILKTAQALAAAGKYEDAISTLFAIPMGNKDFQRAQQMIAQYGSMSLDNKNMEVVRKARAAWSADPTESGAGHANSILSGLEAPSAKVQQEAKALQSEMAARIKAVADREHQLEAQKIQNEKDVQLATINATVKVAKAYAESRPKVVYRFYWW